MPSASRMMSVWNHALNEIPASHALDVDSLVVTAHRTPGTRTTENAVGEPDDGCLLYMPGFVL
jgi:hypothetical protein